MALPLLVLCGACWHLVPVADARGHVQGSGPPGNAYPLAGERSPALDPWGFVARQCTSYVAWHLNAHGTPFGVLTRGPGGGGLFTSAGSRDRAAAAAGFPVRHTPAVGSIAQRDPGEASPAAPARALHDGGPTAGRVRAHRSARQLTGRRVCPPQAMLVAPIRTSGAPRRAASAVRSSICSCDSRSALTRSR